MTEPSVENIVARVERDMKLERDRTIVGGLLSLAELRVLIASWRDRWTALTMIRDNDPDSWEASVARAALKDKP